MDIANVTSELRRIFPGATCIDEPSREVRGLARAVEPARGLILLRGRDARAADRLEYLLITINRIHMWLTLVTSGDVSVARIHALADTEEGRARLARTARETIGALREVGALAVDY